MDNEWRNERQGSTEHSVASEYEVLTLPAFQLDGDSFRRAFGATLQLLRLVRDGTHTAHHFVVQRVEAVPHLLGHHRDSPTTQQGQQL